jgi:hypothetical protein
LRRVRARIPSAGPLPCHVPSTRGRANAVCPAIASESWPWRTADAETWRVGEKRLLHARSLALQTACFFLIEHVPSLLARFNALV